MSRSTAHIGHGASAYESPFDLRVVMLCSMAGTLMQALDSTIANVALPYMQGNLSASRDQITWVLTSYIVASAIMTAPVGWIAARFGKKNFAIVSLAGFTITSMLCGMAQNLDQIIFFRLLQGAFGAALSPLSQSMMLDLYPPEKRGQVMAIWGMGVMVGPILGPTLGGYLTDVSSWRWVFYVNVPFGVAAVAGIWYCYKDTARDNTLKFDWSGFVILAIALASFQLMLDRGTDKDWFGSQEIILEAVIAGLCAYLFLVHLFTAKRPFIPPEIFKDRNLVSSLLMMFIVGSLLLASSALLPPYLQGLGGYSVTETGLLMSPRGLGTMASMMIAGRLLMKVDARWLMMFGALIMSWSMWEMSHWTPDISAWTLVWVTVVQGFGMGFVFIPMNVFAFATLPAHFRTDGTAVMNLMRNLGMAIGVSVTTTFLASSIQTNHAQIAEHVSPFNRALAVNAPSMMWNPQLPFGLGQLNAIVNDQASIIAYANDFLLMFFVSLPVLLVIMLMKKPASKPTPDQIEIME
ncbi:MAG TPA: DHA2 family efflux MFS transporter permease subunit [Rhizomicrobium sp.]|nr:DHA2 family efflux MFS transporter permease subunit [Rhizomicrobium sp.]